MSGRKLWVVALALWFLMWGLLALTNIQFQASSLIMGLLAVAVAVLVAFDR